MTDHLQHAAAAVVVLVVCLEVLGQSIDAMGKDRNLYLGRTGVTLVRSVLSNDGLLFVLSKHCIFHLSFITASAQRQVGECREYGFVLRPRKRHADSIIAQSALFVKGFLKKTQKNTNIILFMRDSLPEKLENAEENQHTSKHTSQ